MYPQYSCNNSQKIHINSTNTDIRMTARYCWLLNSLLLDTIDYSSICFVLFLCMWSYTSSVVFAVTEFTDEKLVVTRCSFGYHMYFVHLSVTRRVTDARHILHYNTYRVSILLTSDIYLVLSTITSVSDLSSWPLARLRVSTHSV
jgi:hypothetical protein